MRVKTRKAEKWVKWIPIFEELGEIFPKDDELLRMFFNYTISPKVFTKLLKIAIEKFEFSWKPEVLEDEE